MALSRKDFDVIDVGWVAQVILGYSYRQRNADFKRLSYCSSSLQMLGPTLKVSYSAGLGWGPSIAFLASS